MLNTKIEKQNDERLISLREIPVKVTSTSPFDSTEDIILFGDFQSIVKGKIELRTKDEAEITRENIELEHNIKENQIKNALKDLKKFPNNPFILNNLGLAYLGNKEIEKAFEIFENVTKLKPDFVPAALNLMSLYVARKDYDTALKNYEKLLRNNPDDTRILISLANINFEKRQFREAKDIYEKIIKIDAKNITSRNHLALINLIEHKSAEAISELRKCIQINNELPAIYNNLGVAFSAIGAYKKAIQSFKTALKIFPYYASAVYNFAISLKRENIFAAIDLLEDYLERKENFQIRELLARFYLENKQFQKALKNISSVFEFALKIGKDDKEIARLHNNIGVIYHSIRDFKKAEDNYLACIKRVGYDNKIIISNIIDLYFDSSKIETAKEYIDIFKDNFGEKEFYFYYLAKYYYAIGKLKDSIDFMKKFLVVNKNFPPAYAFLSNIYSEHLQNYRDAILLNKMGIENLPNEGSIINNLAYNYLMNNEINEAAEILNKSKYMTENIFLTATNGLLYIKRGNINEGRRLYNRAANLAGSTPLHDLVMQKKHLELAKYFFVNGESNRAEDETKKVFSIMKGNETIYKTQAKELSEKIG